MTRQFRIRLQVIQPERGKIYPITTAESNSFFDTHRDR